MENLSFYFTCFLIYLIFNAVFVKAKYASYCMTASYNFYFMQLAALNNTVYFCVSVFACLSHNIFVV
jgi:hypothetical protein